MLSASEAAKRLGCNLRQIRGLATAGEIKSYRVHRNTMMFTEEAVRAFLQKQQPQKPRDLSRRQIYFIQMLVSKHVKIGVAIDLVERVNTLRCGNPEVLTVLAAIPGGQAKESRLHKLFQFDRLEGEWFRWSVPLGETIHRLKAGEDWNAVFEWLEPAMEKHESDLKRKAIEDALKRFEAQNA